MTDPLANVTATLLAKSIPWHTAAGYIVVLILAWRYLGYGWANDLLFLSGHGLLPPLEPFSISDALALSGVPLAGIAAQRMAR